MGAIIAFVNEQKKSDASGAALLTLDEAAQLLPHRPHPSALWRWARRGLRARDGRVIRLAHVRIGGRIFVTLQAIREFGAALAAGDVAGFEAEECRGQEDPR
jgi:hypothetical protein